MRRIKLLNAAYFCVQSAVTLIYFLQVPVALSHLGTVGPLVAIDFLLGFIQCFVGILSMMEHIHTDNMRQLMIANYIPVLILIEGGVIAMFGGILIALATASNYLQLRRSNESTR